MLTSYFHALVITAASPFVI